MPYNGGDVSLCQMHWLNIYLESIVFVVKQFVKPIDTKTNNTLCVNVCYKNVFISFVFIVFNSGFIDNHCRFTREDSSPSDDGGDSQSTIFVIGGGEYLNQTPSPTTSNNIVAANTMPLSTNNLASSQSNNNHSVIAAATNSNNFSNLTSAHSANVIATAPISSERLVPAKMIRRRRI